MLIVSICTIGLLAAVNLRAVVGQPAYVDSNLAERKSAFSPFVNKNLKVENYLDTLTFDTDENGELTRPIYEPMDGDTDTSSSDDDRNPLRHKDASNTWDNSGEHDNDLVSHVSVNSSVSQVDRSRRKMKQVQQRTRARGNTPSWSTRVNKPYSRAPLTQPSTTSNDWDNIEQLSRTSHKLSISKKSFQNTRSRWPEEFWDRVRKDGVTFKNLISRANLVNPRLVYLLGDPYQVGRLIHRCMIRLGVVVAFYRHRVTDQVKVTILYDSRTPDFGQKKRLDQWAAVADVVVGAYHYNGFEMMQLHQHLMAAGRMPFFVTTPSFEVLLSYVDEHGVSEKVIK
ncbi:hypothetical protein H4R33_005285 [Dimargaris cristalligena]|nr:hypothetical protein H4R33_005285 [Dimargaris cristalligena]